MNKQIKNMNAADENICGIARNELAAGVLKQAAADLRRFHGATSAVEWEFYLDAYCWLTTDDSSWPFSFLNVCHLLNLTPKTVREELVGDMWSDGKREPTSFDEAVKCSSIQQPQINLVENLKHKTTT